MVTPPDIEAQILRYYHVEKWRVGTIAGQLHVHHSVVTRVLAQAGLPRIGPPARPSQIDAYLTFIRQTLATFPTLTASRLYGMVRERGYRGSADHFRHLIACHRPRPQAEAAADLSGTVIGPRIYEHEDIPSALRADEILRVLEVTREDLSPTGLRDYAILMLLAAYGLRAAEIVRLRLEDLDWRREVLRVRHSKTGAYSELPLLNEPGEALLGYLEKARPPSTYREIFLRLLPPHRPSKAGSILNCVTKARLRAAGIAPQGRHGPHAFRHARAVSLLRSGVPLKIIGDLLGHTSAHATAEYLKLATDDLRAVGLELPSGVSP